MSYQRSDLRKTLKYSQSRDLEGIQWILWIYTDAAVSRLLQSIRCFMLHWRSLWRSCSESGGIHWQTGISRRVSPACARTRHPIYNHQCLHSTWRWCQNWVPTFRSSGTTNQWFRVRTDRCRPPSCRCLDLEYWTANRWRVYQDEQSQQVRHARLRWTRRRSDDIYQPQDPPRMTNIRPSTSPVSRWIWKHRIWHT